MLYSVLAACDGGAGSDAGVAPRDASAGSDATPRADAGPPPAGDGIAARYPGDEGIEADPDVIFADDFESYADASGLDARWDEGVYHEVRIATEAERVFAGRQALELRMPAGDSELSNTVARRVRPELDVLHLRYYSRYDPTFDVSGSSHNGAGISAHYYVDGMATPGIPADGTNKFLIELEAWRAEPSEPTPGSLNVYIYHPLQRSMWGDHFFPDGTVLPNSSLPFDWGAGFVPRSNLVPELGRWYCYELMLRANTPGASDGRITVWIDGEIAADFPNLRVRDVDALTIDRFNLSFHAGRNPTGETFKQYDNVVAATSYIGPLAPRP